MNYKFAITTVALSFFTLGCTAQEGHDGHDHAKHEKAEAKSVESEPTVTLDNGKRWKANPETTSGIANMMVLVDKQIAEKGDAKAAKAGLEKEFGLIFERCTMTGEAHNQLHNYLIPIHQKFSGFDAGDATQLAEMKTYLGTYGNYFE